MAKQWFNYVLPTTTLSPQITASNYTAQGAYTGAAACSLANRTCLIYSFYSSGSPVRPSNTIGGAPGLSPNLQSYITSFVTGGAPVEPQPGLGKKYVYVRGT